MSSGWRADLVVGMRLALRARFITTGFWLSVLIAIAALLSAQFSGRQPATVALDIGISSIRLLLPLVVILLTQELFYREFDRRYFLTSIAYPRPRHAMFLGRFVASFILLAILLVIMAILLAVIVWQVGLSYEQSKPVIVDRHYVITFAFILVDLFAILSISSLLAITASTQSFILIGTLGFALVTRSYSTIIMLINQQNELITNPELYKESLGLLVYIVPDLGALDVRAIALYGTTYFLPHNWAEHILRVFAYSGGFVGLSIFALQRKQFS